MNAKTPELPLFWGSKAPVTRKKNFKEHRNVVFEPDDWVWIPEASNSDSSSNFVDPPSYVANSDLRSNPSEEEENDATLVSMQSTILDPKSLMAKVHDERAETEEQTCRSAREKGEATNMSI